MKYGDIVTYIRSEMNLNALVISHDQQTDDVALAFLDPHHDTHGAPATATIVYGVKKLEANGRVGWKANALKADFDALNKQSAETANALRARILELEGKYANSTEGKDEALQSLADAGARKADAPDGPPSPECPPHGPCEVSEAPTAEVEVQK